MTRSCPNIAYILQPAYNNTFIVVQMYYMQAGICKPRDNLFHSIIAEGQSLPCMQASKLPPAVDRAWEKIGGGPADLYFPEEFLGVWNVESTLTSIKLPLGPDYVPDLKVGPIP